MERWMWLLFVMVVAPICNGWRSSSEEDRKPMREDRRGVHYHTKRHMLPSDSDSKKRPASPLRVRETRKKVKAKPSGHLTPLKEDDIDNDEVVSVAIGPPPMRPMYDKMNWKSRSLKNMTSQNGYGTSSDREWTGNMNNGAINMVKDVLTQIGREFLTHQVNEDFVFGQYIGQAMKNITYEQKIKFQHEVLELVIKYQKISRGEVVTTTKPEEKKDPLSMFKETPRVIKNPFNDTDEPWPDFNNLAKLVG